MNVSYQASAVQTAGLFCLLIAAAGCSSEKIDTAAGQPAAEVAKAVATLNDSGAEIVLDSAEVIAVKLPAQTSPKVLATLTSLNKLKRIDATETDLKQPAFADLKSQNPQVEITFPH